MRFYESEAKKLLAKHGVGSVSGKVAASAADAERAASELGGSVILKAEVISPAAFKAGAVKSAANATEARQAAEALLKLDDGGRKPAGILVEKKIAASYSLAFTYDGARKLPVMAASSEIGNIETIADEHPDRVARRHFSALVPFSDYLAKELVNAVGLEGPDSTALTPIVARLAQLFLKHDLTQLDVTIGKL